jgi:hypothetical protein
LAFAETPDHGRRMEGSPFMLAVPIEAADSTGVSDRVERRALVCGRCGYGIAVVRPALRCPMCGAFDWRPRGSAGLRRPSGAAEDERGLYRDEASRQRRDPRDVVPFPRRRAEPEWMALVPGHLATEDRADAVVSSTAAAIAHERNDVRITVEASDERGSPWQMQRLIS